MYLRVFSCCIKIIQDRKIIFKALIQLFFRTGKSASMTSLAALEKRTRFARASFGISINDWFSNAVSGYQTHWNFVAEAVETHFACYGQACLCFAYSGIDTLDQKNHFRGWDRRCGLPLYPLLIAQGSRCDRSNDRTSP